MNWLNELLDDCFLELAIEEQCCRIAREDAVGGDRVRIMQKHLQDLIGMRSPGQVARMERERLERAMRQK